MVGLLRFCKQELYMDDKQTSYPWALNDEPIYNIGVVSRMTAIPVATLRVWERRYNFPDAGRTSGGHRLYSEQEMARLRWVKIRIEEGMQTSQAIRALLNHERQTHTPQPGPLVAEPPPDDARTLLRARFSQTLQEGDLERADQVLGEMMAVYPLETVILDVIAPALVDMGEAWRSGRVDVATEHLASAFLRQRLSMWLTTAAAARVGRPLVLACAPNEWHELGLLMLAVLLHRRRWPVAYLGQAMPLADLADFVHTVRTPLVVLSATTEESGRILLEQLPQWLAAVQQNGRPVVAYAGRVFSMDAALRARMPGVFLGATLHESLEQIEHLLGERFA